ncbi:MAG: hypothetical protein HY547_02495 [Elusimicrobia bacterium]|nr:hypothetical protein [Elusimicrobiota bacterium]
MLIYFDESYDDGHNLLIWGALFNPHSKFLHRKLTEIKKNHGFVDKNGEPLEIKYNNCGTQRHYNICKEIIDAFFDSTSWFRCIVVESKLFDLNRFGKPYESIKIKQARAYKKFSELLLAHNTENAQGAVLLADYMTRCHGDEFVTKIRELFSEPNAAYSEGKAIPTIARVEEINSKRPQYQVNNVNDILMGCVLNNNFPTRNPYKNKIREYLVGKLGVPNFLKESWIKYSKTYVEKYCPKFNVWYLRLKESVDDVKNSAQVE